ncbi:MAG: hypothetical protein AB7E80_05480 [Hyphomicrobiaceae bacterium]
MPMRRLLHAVGIVLVVMCQPAGLARAAGADDASASVWTTLLRYETQAIRSYEFHLLATGGVRDLGDEIWLAARTPPFQQKRDTCGSAAETLSYMVTGYYLAGLRREISRDWHFFAKRYMDRRSACLAELNLDEGAYPLPRWFGR